jgi:hypothetical protein
MRLKFGNSGYKELHYMKSVFDCYNISKHLSTNEFPQKKTTPFTVLAPKHYLDRIDFEAIINNKFDGIKISGEFPQEHLHLAWC